MRGRLRLRAGGESGDESPHSKNSPIPIGSQPRVMRTDTELAAEFEDEGADTQSGRRVEVREISRRCQAAYDDVSVRGNGDRCARFGLLAAKISSIEEVPGGSDLDHEAVARVRVVPASIVGGLKGPRSGGKVR